MVFRIFAMLGLLTLPVMAIADDAIDTVQFKFFESHVRPLLASKCVQCHGAEKQKGELRLDSLAAMLKEYVIGRERGPLFQSRNGSHLTPGHARRRFEIWARRAGLRAGTSPHSCRHARAIKVYRATGDLFDE